MRRRPRLVFPLRLALIGVGITAAAVSVVGVVGVASAATRRASADGAVASTSPSRGSDNGDGSYLAAMRAANAGVSVRWAADAARPRVLRVWVDSAPALEDWTPEHAARVRAAARAWLPDAPTAALPLAVAFVAVAGEADITVRWCDRFATQSGRTRRAQRGDGHVVGAEILLALHRPDGQALPSWAVESLALHELGHALGLDPVAAPDGIMAPVVRRVALSRADRATLRALYAQPPQARSVATR